MVRVLQRSLVMMNACIAVAEDDDDMRQVLVHALQRDGHRVVALSNGVQLLMQLAHRFRHGVHPRIDLIVSDIRMPTMTGLEILRGLRRGQCLTPVVLLTAFGDRETRAEAEALGAALLDKPLALADLRREVRQRLLGRAPDGAT